MKPNQSKTLDCCEMLHNENIQKQSASRLDLIYFSPQFDCIEHEHDESFSSSISQVVVVVLKLGFPCDANCRVNLPFAKQTQKINTTNICIPFNRSNGMNLGDGNALNNTQHRIIRIECDVVHAFVKHHTLHRTVVQRKNPYFHMESDCNNHRRQQL